MHISRRVFCSVLGQSFFRYLSEKALFVVSIGVVNLVHKICPVLHVSRLFYFCSSDCDIRKKEILRFRFFSLKLLC